MSSSNELPFLSAVMSYVSYELLLDTVCDTVCDTVFDTVCDTVCLLCDMAV